MPKKRCEQLRSVLSLLDEMSAKIRYSSVKMRELLLSLSEEGSYTGCFFVQRTASELQKGSTANEAWCEAARTAFFLTDSDRRILTDIGCKLGETDTDGQVSMLTLGAAMLGRELEAAERDVSAKSGAVLKVWVLCGIGAGIIMI